MSHAEQGGTRGSVGRHRRQPTQHYRARHRARRRLVPATAVPATAAALTVAAIATPWAAGTTAAAAAQQPSAQAGTDTYSSAAWHFHPALAATGSTQAMPLAYTVRPGDTLSQIAGHFYGSQALWPALWWVNKSKVANPNVIQAGERLTLSPWHPRAAWLAAAADRAMPRPVVTAAVVTQRSGTAGDREPDGDSDDGGGYRTQAGYSSAARAGSYGSVNPGSYGGFQACVIARESGGQSQVMNATGHYGLYQFAYGTWVANGGSPGSFGHASVSEQNQVFANTVRSSGYSAWTPYDGC